MRRWRASRGFSILELMVVLALFGVLATLVASGWRAHVAQQRLRYGVAQVAMDLRGAQERAKAERAPYVVTFTAASSAYTIARSGVFLENARLPDGITAMSNVVVVFSAFGRPDAARTITIGGAAGTASVSLNAAGGVTYQEP